MIFVVRIEGFSDKLYFHVDIDGEKKTVLRSLPSPLALPETRGSCLLYTSDAADDPRVV